MRYIPLLIPWRPRQFWLGSVRHLSTSIHISMNINKNNNIMNQYLLIRTISSSNLATPVYTHALKHGPRLAITDDTTSYTYSSLYNHSTRLARLLGQRQGERVAFLTPNNGQYVVVQWGVWMSGGVAVPLCKTHPPSTLRYYVEDSQASLIIVTEDLKDKVADLGAEVMVVGDDNIDEAVDTDQAVLEADTPAMMLYTSGTTGPPKGVVLTHRNLESQASCLISAWDWTREDKILHVLPLHHVHGIINCLLCPLTVGASVHMLGSFNAGKVWDILTSQQYSVNVFMAVPTIYAKLLEYFSKAGLNKDETTITLSNNIRLMVSGSAALPVPVLEAWREVSGHTLLERYGMTEIGMALSNPLAGERIPGCVGRPLPGVQARLVRWGEGGVYEVLAEGDSNDISTNNSEEGELLIKGPNVFKEYFKKPEATKKEFTEDGWFKTGDTAKIESGVFKILGRTSVDIIKSGGYKISALDVERVLLSHPDIADVAVVGVDDQTWGQKVAAVVVLNKGTSMDLGTLKEWSKDKMAKYWTPTELKILDDMPRNTMGKVNKKELVKTMF